MITLLKQAKHRGFVFSKHARWRLQLIIVPAVDPLFRAYQRLFPRPFDALRYRGTFLDWCAPDPPRAANHAIDRRIFCIWSGRNEMPPIRQASLRAIRAMNPECDVALVTAENLEAFVLPEHPLHPAFENLSLVHRSDYLRCYLLHHYGGGYSDIKRPLHPWQGAFCRLEASDKWLAGYREVKFDHVPVLPPPLGRDLVRVSSVMIGHGSYIARKGTPLTEEWLAEVTRVLDEHAEDLARHPGNERGTNPGYPLRWTRVLADILSPLVYKHGARVKLEPDLTPDLKNYR